MRTRVSAWTLIRASFTSASVASLVFTPALRGEDLPSVDTVIKKVIERAKRKPEVGDKDKDPKYVYQRHVVTEELGARGGVKERREQLYQAVIINGEVYNRLVEKNGKPLTADDQKREQEREKKFRDTATERKEKKAKGGEDAVVLNEELLSKYKIAMVNREPIEGRTALVATFEPKSRDLPAKRRIDFVLNKMAGKIWIDEQEYEPVKVEFRLTEPAEKYGGLLATVRKLDGSWEQKRLEGGEWLPRRLENHFEGRIVFKSLDQRTTVEWRDFSKVSPEDKK